MEDIITIYKRTLADLTHRKTRKSKIKIALVMTILDVITILKFNLGNRPLEACVVSMAFGFLGGILIVLP